MNLEIHGWLLNIVWIKSRIVGVDLFVCVHSLCHQQQKIYAIGEHCFIRSKKGIDIVVDIVGIYYLLGYDRKLSDLIPSILVSCEDEINQEDDIFELLSILDVLLHFLYNFMNYEGFYVAVLFCIAFLAD